MSIEPLVTPPLMRCKSFKMFLKITFILYLKLLLRHLAINMLKCKAGVFVRTRKNVKRQNA